METEKKAGVKKGTKRGPYKKTLKQNEEIINSNIEQEIKIINKAREQEIIKPIQNEVINEVSNNSIPEPSILTDNISSGNQEGINEFREPEPTTQKPSFEQTSGEEKLNTFFEEYKDTSDQPNVNTQTTSTTPTFQHNQQMKMLINGYMLLSLCDVVFPYGIKFLFGLFNPKAKKVKVIDMKLEPEQREALMNSADAVAQYVFEKANPMTVFIICLGLFYGTNFQEAMQRVKE